MKHIRKKIVAAVLCAALCLALAGCTPAGEAYPVSLGGVNITVGETTVGPCWTRAIPSVRWMKTASWAMWMPPPS